MRHLWVKIYFLLSLSQVNYYGSLDTPCPTSGACIIKLITAVINSVTQKAGVFVKPSKKWLTKAKALAYCTTELITAAKSFMIQAPGGCANCTCLIKNWSTFLSLNISYSHGKQKQPLEPSNSKRVIKLFFGVRTFSNKKQLL